MTYTPIKTWSTGDVLTGDDLDRELSNLKSYTHQIGSTDLKNVKFVDTQHIMPGTIDAQTNVTHNCTGIFGGQQHSYQSLNYTFLTKYNTVRTSFNSNNVVIPETTFTVNIGRNATVFFSWWIQEQSRQSTTPPVAKKNYFVGVHNITAIPNGTHVSMGDTQSKTISTNVPFSAGNNISATNYLTGFTVLDGTSGLNFFMGLRGRTENNHSQVLSWGVCLELFYM
jgi:hypothetical protein